MDDVVEFFMDGLIVVISALAALAITAIMVACVAIPLAIITGSPAAPASYRPPATNDGTGNPQHGAEAVLTYEFLMEIAVADGATVNGKTPVINRAPRTELSPADLHTCYDTQDWLSRNEGRVAYKIFDGLSYICGGG